MIIINIKINITIFLALLAFYAVSAEYFLNQKYPLHLYMTYYFKYCDGY